MLRRREGPFKVLGYFREERGPAGGRAYGGGQQTLPPRTPALKTSLRYLRLLSYLGYNCPASQTQPCPACRLHPGPWEWELECEGGETQNPRPNLEGCAVWHGPGSAHCVFPPPRSPPFHTRAKKNTST